MFSTYLNQCGCHAATRRMLSLLLSLAVVLLLLQFRTIHTGGAGDSRQSISGEAGAGASRRGLLQQQQQQQQQSREDLLSALGDAPESDPFAGSHLDRPLLGRLTALLPKTLQQQLQLLRHSLWRAVQDHTSSGPAHTAVSHKRRHHHRVVRHNVTHSWVHSPVLQLELPQPWDTINLTKIVRDNLEPDVLFWQQLHRQPSYADVLQMAQEHNEMAGLSATRRLVELKDNQLRFPLLPPGHKQYQCDEECDPQMQGFVDAVEAAVKVFNMTLPNVLFILNTNDAPVCTEEQVMRAECRAPVISLTKETGVADLVGPVLKLEDADVHHLRYLPWEDKLDKAFFRGVPSCGQMPFPPSCARSWIARMAQINYTQDLDAGLVEPYDRPDQVAADPVLRDGHGPLPVLPRVPMNKLPNYRYLLNLDGHTAAYRLGHLLATNSLVLKQESIQMEHYYRSLRPYHHYLPILKHSEHDVMPRLHWARQHDAHAQRIVNNANRFALRYLTFHARVLYLKYVLLAYRSALPDMDEYFQRPPPAAGTQMEQLLKAQLAAIQKQQGKSATLATVPRGGNVRIGVGDSSALNSVTYSTAQAKLADLAELAGDDEDAGGDNVDNTSMMFLAGGDL